MVRPLERGRKTRHAYARIRFTQIGRSSLEALFFATIGTRARVTILEHRVRRKMRIDATEWPEGCNPPHELDGLQLAAEFKFEHIAKCDVVGGGKSKRLELRVA